MVSNLKAIVAVDKDNGIGVRGEIPWFRYKANLDLGVNKDMKLFQQKTSGFPVIMGRKTWDSLLTRPLKNRKNFIITRDRDLRLKTNSKDKIVYTSAEQLIQHFDNFTTQSVWVVGGAEIYSLFEPYLSEIHVTQFNIEYDCDTFFPIDVNSKFWNLVYSNNLSKNCTVRKYIRQS